MAQIERARKLIASGGVIVHSVGQSDTRANETKILATVRAGGESHEVLAAVDQDARLRFARCDCDFFTANIMSQGPCEHILAARFAADSQLAAVEKRLRLK